MRNLLLVLLLACVFYLPSGARVAYAEDAPLFSKTRVSVAAGLDYAKQSKPVGANQFQQWELKPSFNLAYNLGSKVSLVGSYSRGLKSDVDEYRAGFRLRLYRGAAQ